MKTTDAGRIGEALAERALKREGMRLLVRNYRAGRWEIDLIMRDRRTDMLVFVEVKARSGTRFGLPREAVTPQKQAYLRRAAQMYLIETGMTETPCRFDVAEVWLDTKEVVRIENAF